VPRNENECDKQEQAEGGSLPCSAGATIMAAQDKTFTWGQIGLGSFDGIGDFDDVVARGVRVEKQ
jgi:hypothetical protein